MADRFSGKLTLPEQDVVAVDLEISPDALTLRTENVLIGTWPLKYCRVSKIGASEYRLSVDGEVVSFEPDEARKFAIVAAQRFKASSLADRINVVRAADEPDDEEIVEEPEVSRPRLDPEVLRSPAVRIGLAIVAVLVLAWLGVRAITGGEETVADPPPVSIESTDIDAEAAVPAFEADTAAFVVEWNRRAQSFGATDLLIRSALPRGSFEVNLAPLISLQGTTGDDGDVRSLVVVADPSGDPDSDRLAIAAWGIAIAVADPSLTESERRSVLTEMGLDVNNPQLGGLDGSTERNGIRYSMQFFQSFSSVLLSLTEVP